MILNIRTRSIGFIECAFSINFVAFSFVMFSCWFPTGFSATFSTLAFVFACMLAFYNANWSSVQVSSPEKNGLALFAWLALSVFWSQVGLVASLELLSEYRIYIMVPIFVHVLKDMPLTRKAAIYAALAGALFALVASYGLGLGWWQVEGAEFSLANRIYHGFIMAILLLIALLVARYQKGALRVAAIMISLLTIYNVVNIEWGRTAYLQVGAVCLTFIVLSFGRYKSAVLAIAFGILLVSTYASLEQFQSRIDETLVNVERVFSAYDVQSSAGFRIELARVALRIGIDHPLGGVGVGDVALELERRAQAGELVFYTDNVHGEFFNMLIAGGLPAVLLFLSFIVSIARLGFLNCVNEREIGHALIGLAVIVFIGALFNSIIKDYGEKSALMIVLSLAISSLLVKPSKIARGWLKR